MVIDLIFTPPGVAIELPQRRMVELQGLSDHIPLLGKTCIRPLKLEVTRITIPKESDEEDAFLGDLFRLVRSVSVLPIMSQDGVEERANAFASVFSTAWETNVVEVVIKSYSKGWWSKECSEAIKHYWDSHNPWHYKQFQLVIRDAKQIFFDKQINKVASLSKRPWDLMSWVKQHNLPPMESISF
jgi:predicted transposase YbfD/YdcC